MTMWTRTIRVWCVGVLALAWALPSSAQPPPAVRAMIDGTLRAGQCQITVKLSQAGPPGALVQLSLNKNPLSGIKADGKQSVTVTLKGPLGGGDEVQARLSVPPGAPPDWGDATRVEGRLDAPECAAAKDDATPADDGRKAFEPSGYLGLAFDNFAPGIVGGYPASVAGGVSKKRFVQGVDFQFRAIGTPQSTKQLWIIGETLHGVRSADVNCKDEPKPPVCEPLGTKPNEQARYILENASSFEGFLGVRLELLTLQSGRDFPAKLYVTAQFGVMMLAGQVTRADNIKLDVNRAYDADHVGVGLLSPSGRFSGSHLELGWGRTDLFSVDQDYRRWRRLKVDGLLLLPSKIPNVQAFVQIFADFDPTKRSADSVQTFVGLDFDIGKLFGEAF